MSRILDEEIEEITFEEEADLVGISFMTHQAPRAYEISEKFRKRGIKTILGGIHVSALPDEALNHADSICVGEAEHLWKGILDDLKKGQLKKIYKAVSYHNLKSLPFPRLDLLKRECIFIPIYSSRGCPFRCEFCSVSRFFGSRYRRRPVEEVMEEIRFRKIERMEFTGWSNEPQLVLFWIDDNICENKAYAYSLFRNLANFKIKWIAQTTLNVAKDVNLLELMRKAGCFGLGIGIESLSQENLNFVKKDFLKGIAFLNTPRLFGGDISKAIKELEMAINLFEEEKNKDSIMPDWGKGESYLWLSRAYFKYGNKKKAMEVTYKGISKCPDYLILTKYLEKLKESKEEED